MILVTGNKVLPWLRDVCRKVSSEETQRLESKELEPESLVYIGAGYWRIILVGDPEHPDRIAGGRLINPDRSPAEIRTVEQAVCILLRLEYQD